MKTLRPGNSDAISGTVNGIIHYFRRGSTCARKSFSSNYKQTLARVPVLSQFRMLQKYYSENINPDQRALWDAFDMPRVDSLGNPINLTAMNKFNAVNSILLSAGKSIVDIPPLIEPAELVTTLYTEDNLCVWMLDKPSALIISTYASVVQLFCAGIFTIFENDEDNFTVQTAGFSPSINPVESDYILVGNSPDLNTGTGVLQKAFGGADLSPGNYSLYFMLRRIYNNGGFTSPLYVSKYFTAT